MIKCDLLRFVGANLLQIGLIHSTKSKYVLLYNTWCRGEYLFTTDNSYGKLEKDMIKSDWKPKCISPNLLVTIKTYMRHQNIGGHEYKWRENYVTLNIKACKIIPVDHER